jgi:FkbM family methyltransferase
MPTNVIYDVNYHGDDPPVEKLSKQVYLHNQHLTSFPEDDEIQFLLTNLEEGDHVLDLGANIGLHAINFCNAVGENGTVIAFEPMKKNYDILLSNIEKHKAQDVIVPVNSALGSINKEIQFDINTVNMGDCRSSEALNKDKLVDNKNFDHETVSQITLDDYFDINLYSGVQWEKVRLIKMDTQGCEIDILKGASNLFKRGYTGSIFLEFSPYMLNNNNQDIEWFYKFIVDNMFTVFNCPIDQPWGTFKCTLIDLDKIKGLYKDQIREESRYQNLILQKFMPC